jgi:N6-L-threonylcarbamoyladenine synthase
VPALGVHHMEGHLLAPMLEPDPPNFPFVALLVSGGHSLLVRVDGSASTRFSASRWTTPPARRSTRPPSCWGCRIPAGRRWRSWPNRAIRGRFTFPRPMTDRPGCDFSFSGLKTAALNTWRGLEPTPENRADVARAFEEAVVDTLAIKCRRALQTTGLKRLVVAGGVGANRRLRERLRELAVARGGRVYYPRLEFCTDNGAMIAYAGWRRLAAGQRDDAAIEVLPRWPLDQSAGGLGLR